MKNSSAKAYTLLEQAISISILSVVLVMLLLLGERRHYQNGYQHTQEKITVIDRAIIAKYLELSPNNSSTLDYHLFPCPAPISTELTDKDFGVSIDDEDDNSCAATTGLTSVGSDYFHGSIPTRTLSIRDDFAFDFWGNHFSFIANNKLLGLFEGSIDIGDLDEIAYFIISHGANGYGAHTKSGSQLGSSSASTEELYNIYNETSPAFSINNIQDRPRTTTYDDIVFYRTIGDFLANTSGGTLLPEDDCNGYSASISDNNLKRKVEAQCTVF